MAKLSDTFLHLLGGVLEGASGMTPEVKAELAQRQQQIDNQRLNSLANMSRTYDINLRSNEPVTAGIDGAMSAGPTFMGLPMNVPGLGKVHLSPKAMSDTIVQTDESGNPVGTVNVKHSQGGRTLITKPAFAGSNSRDERTRQMAAAKLKDKALTELNDLDSGFQQIKNLFDKKSALSQKGLAGGPLSGTYAKTKSFITGGGFGTEEVKAFGDLRSGLIARLKRVTGDTGVLTETDAQRLIGLLSSLNETDPASLDKLNEIKNIFDGAKLRSKNKANTLINEIQSGRDISTIDDSGVFGNPPQQPLLGQNAASSTNQGTITIKASDGSIHSIPAINFERARQRDPGLQVVTQ